MANTKIEITKLASNSAPAYYHLDSVVQFLLVNGNKSINEFIWGINRTGCFCHLKKPIDFESLLDSFTFPKTIVLNNDQGGQNT